MSPTAARSGAENSSTAGIYEKSDAGEAGLDAGASSLGGVPGGAGNVGSQGGSAQGGAATGGGGTAGVGGRPDGGYGGQAGFETGGGAGTGTATLCELVQAHGDTSFVLAESITAGYIQILDTDCRYTGLKCGVGFPAKGDFANGLTPFALNLWHCYEPPASQFLLVHPGRMVTKADAEALIELYVELTLQKLKLSAGDAEDLRKQLVSLMPASLSSNAPRISLCSSGGVCPSSGSAGSAGTGGASGSGNSSGGSSGQGGTN